MNLRWLLLAKRTSQHPPSWKRVRLILIVVALCLIVAGYEYLFGTPAWVNQEVTKSPSLFR